LTAATARGSAGTTYPSLAISHHRITSHLLRPCQGSLTNFYNSTTPPTHPPTHQKECFCIYFTLFIYYIEGKKKSERFDLGEGERREGVNDGWVDIERDEMMEWSIKKIKDVRLGVVSLIYTCENDLGEHQCWFDTWLTAGCFPVET
jgi:hypothetical protein